MHVCRSYSFGVPKVNVHIFLYQQSVLKSSFANKTRKNVELTFIGYKSAWYRNSGFSPVLCGRRVRDEREWVERVGKDYLGML